MNSEPHEGFYLYGIIASRQPQSFASRGIGERGDEVFTMHYDDLAAVVSASPIIEYESTRRNLMSHTRVLEEVMQHHTLLPMRFGMIAPNETAITEDLLHARANELREILAHLSGKIELGLKAFWFEEAIFNTILAENPPIRELRDRLAQRGPDESYYERIHLGELVEAAMSRKRAEDSEQILAKLRPLVEDLQVSPALTDRMVVNAAFLLDRSQEAAFDAAINALDGELGTRMMFKYVGPVPPYNFVTISI